jgi:hypothetical protein
MTMVLGSGFRRNDNGFWVLAFAGMTMFFAGNTQKERAELSYKTQL